MKKYLLQGSIIHALLVWTSLVFGYNSFKEYMRHVAPLTRILRDAIQSTFPWAILIFVALYIVFFIKQKTVKIFFPMRQYIYILSIYSGLLNLIFFIKGKDLLIPLNLSILYFIALFYMLQGLKKAWQISYTKAQKSFPTIFHGNAMLFNFITLSLTLLVSLSIGEAYLRYEHKKEHDILVSKYKDRELCTAYSADPGLIYTFIPNKCGNNSHGYRDYKYSYKKETGSFRIIVIGDSVAQGQGVDLQESFGKVLETKLNQSVKNRQFEVIVLARSGYSTSQELILLENEALTYQPDLIIWSYMLNDPAHPVYHDANGELGRYYFKPKLHIIIFFSKKIFQIKESIKGKN
ncbi:MAG: SGNH/GDSL hydrolase family protein, partial [Nitrospirota bacterium]